MAPSLHRPPRTVERTSVTELEPPSVASTRGSSESWIRTPGDRTRIASQRPVASTPEIVAGWVIVHGPVYARSLRPVGTPVLCGAGQVQRALRSEVAAAVAGAVRLSTTAGRADAGAAVSAAGRTVIAAIAARAAADTRRIVELGRA